MNTRLLGALAVLSFQTLALSAGEVVFTTDFNAATPSGAGEPAVDAGGTVNSGYEVSMFTQGPGYPGTIRLLDPEPEPTGDLFLGVPAGQNGDGMPTTLEDAGERGEYFEFTVTAPGPLDFTELAFSLVGYGSGKVGCVTVRSSVDGYASDLTTVTGVLSGDMNVRGKYPATIDLTSMKSH